MARQSNIVDLEEARQSARSSSARASRPRGNAVRPERGKAKPQALEQASRPSAKTTKTTSATRSAKGARAKASGKQDAKQSVKAAAKPASRQASKKKAERAYEKAVKKASPNASAASDGEPRAAVYKGKMGSTHKKTMRMQKGPVSASGVRKRRFATVPSASPLLRRVAVAAVCLLLAVAFVYPSARDYYLTVRDQARLQAQYELVAARNQALEGNVAALQTNEGIEDRVRAEYGWVRPGENAVVVTGLAQDDTPFDPAALPQAESVPAPETWYSPVLDRVFGYE